MKMLCAVPITQIAKPLTKCLICERTFKKGLYQCAQIKACPADQYRCMFARLNFYNCVFRSASVVPGSEVLDGLDYINQMMRHIATLSERNLCSRDVYSAINLNRIEINNLAFNCKRQLDPEIALAGSRGTHDYGY